MYEQYFGLDHKPFSITPDPRYLFLGARHREALAHLLYGVGEGGGFVQLTGEVGTGKTTLCRSLLEQLPPEVDLALILNPRLDAVELVAAVCDELKIAYPPGCTSLRTLVGALNDHLLQSHAAGRRTVLVIDEAQNLSPEVLEQVRLLTNLETAETKLLEIILLGQPELRENLERPELRQLAQRITARYHLGSLNPEETVAYVRHRLRVAGVSRPLFTPGALKVLARLSGGVPRLINVICDRALLGAYAEDRHQVDERTLRQAAREVRDQGNLPTRWRRSLAAPAQRRRLLLTLLILALLPAGWLAQQVIPTTFTAARNEQTVAPVEPPAAVRATRDETVPAGPADDQAITADQLARLLASPDAGTEAGAWEKLFELWQGSYQAHRPACSQAEEQGLRCREDTGNWTMLRRLDHPALLRLHFPAGPRTVLLTTLGPQQATVQAGDQELTLPLTTLEQYWYGEYQLLWRPPLASRLLQQGDRAPEVARLRQLLARLAARNPDVEPAEPAAPATAMAAMATAEARYFDAELARQVMDFQRARGLPADGMVGPQTLLQLSHALAGPDTPRLRGEPGKPDSAARPAHQEAPEGRE